MNEQNEYLLKERAQLLNRIAVLEDQLNACKLAARHATYRRAIEFGKKYGFCEALKAVLNCRRSLDAAIRL